jgi:hypothetical protein
MGWVLMSERELNRIEILSQVHDGRMTVETAAHLLDMTRRQVFRLLKRYRIEGAASIRHRSRGKVPNNQIHSAKRDYAVTLVKESYPDFGPTLAAEMLADQHGFKVSRETLRKWMIADGIWLPRKERRKFHQPRLRRECLGELIQIDGSDHHWFEDRGPACTLLVFIDDATSTLMQLRFVTSESTFSYFEALELYLATHGRPVAFYSDKHTVFRVAQQGAKTGHGMTQFGRALNELNIEILCANSSQAKGRVERSNRTLQDRLVKELRLAGIADMDAANAFLPGFMARYNARFAKVPRRAENLHRPMNIEPDRLRDVFCLRDQRYVGTQLAFSFERQRIILEANEITRGLVGKYVDSYAFPDGRLEFRWQGVSLPYSIFDKDQRVTHAAITENKHLSAVLEHIKAEQDKVPPKPRRAGKQKTRYEPTGRRNDGWNSKLARRAKAKDTEASSTEVE